MIDVSFINTRGLSDKLDPLKEFANAQSLDFVIVAETWFRNQDEDVLSS